MTVMIEGVKPRSDYRHYSNHSNPSCQGTLIKQTAQWPYQYRRKPFNSYGEWVSADYFNYGWTGRDLRERDSEESESVPVPAGLKIGDAYTDRMWSWDYKKMEEAVKHLSHWLDSSDEELIAFAKAYFGVDVVAVRTVYYYDVSSGYDCARIDYLYKDEPKPDKLS